MNPKSLLFNRAFGDESADRHRPTRPDAGDSIGRLFFKRRIPPQVKVNHIVGRREIEPGAACHQADETNKPAGTMTYV